MTSRSARRTERGRLARAALRGGLGAAGLAVAASAWPALAQGEPPRQPTTPTPVQPEPLPAGLERYENHPIREVRIVGLKSVKPQLVDNQIRSKPGQALQLDVLQQDIQRLARVEGGRFRKIDVKAQAFADGSIVLIYELDEAPVIKGVEAVGNRQLSSQEISGAISLLEGTSVDRFQLDRARRQIQDLYRKKGYYLSEVSVDEEELEKTGVVLFRIREGERIKVAQIRYEEFSGGRLSFSEGQLGDEIKSRETNWFETGPLDDQTLDQDVASLVIYYRDRGYLDVRVGRKVQIAPNGREAIVTFIIGEGAVYTMRSVRVELNDGRDAPSGQPPTVYTPEQLAGLMPIKAGDVYSASKISKSIIAVEEAYGRLGRVNTRVAKAELRDPDKPVVDLLILLTEGAPYKLGIVRIQGDQLTKQSVVRRQLDVFPDRPIDSTALQRSKVRLQDTRLFDQQSIKLTLQPDDPAHPGYKDLLVEVAETNTGSLGFGVSATSDLGLVGEISLRQDNFDVTDFPDSFGEFFSGRAFRGGGQKFNLTLAPGTDVQTYSIALSDPSLFDTDYGGNVSAFYLTREYDEYTEDRVGTIFGIGRRFGERWEGQLTTRIVRIDLRNIDPGAPVDVFEVEAPHTLTGLSGRLTRMTADDRFRPTSGTKFEASVEQVGIFGGDFDFTRMTAAYSLYVPVYESFLGYKTVFSLSSRVGYIPQSKDDVPTYERFYQGGRDFRGFSFRTVSPKGIRHDTMTQGDDPVGGTWSLFVGAELEQPLWKDALAGVIFVDTGTVTNKPGFDQYRVSVGFGVRIYIRNLSPLPLAFDFGFPLIRQDGDDERIFTFSLDLPFK